MRPSHPPGTGTLRKFPIFVDMPATDLVRARRWYEGALGLSPALELGPGLLYESGGIPFLVHPSTVGGVGSSTASWIVDDLRAVMAELRGQGVRFEEYAIGSPGMTTANGVVPVPNGGSAAWFKDPDGNLLSINQLPYDLSLGDLVAAGRPASPSERV